MNPSEKTRWQRFLSWLPYLILLGWFVVYSGLLGRYIYTSSDFELRYYVPGLAPGDWFPPIVWLQLRLYDLLIPGEYDAIQAGKLFGFIWSSALLIASLLITKSQIQACHSPYPFIVCLICVYNPCWINTTCSSIDLATGGLLCLTLALIHNFESKKEWIKYVLLLGIIVFTVLHRKNSVFVLPALCFYLFYAPTHLKKHFYLRWICLVCAVSLAYIIGMNSTYYGLLNMKKSHSENTMLQSDIYCMDLMQGKEPCGNVAKRLGCQSIRCRYDAKIGSEKFIIARYSMRRNDCIPGSPLWTERENIIWKEEWLRSVLNDPICFLMTRAVLTWQHFDMGLCPDFLRQCVQKRYPAAQIPARSPYGDSPRGLYFGGNFRVRRLLVWSYMLSLVLIPLVYYRKRKKINNNHILRLPVAAYTTSLLYTLSLIPCVPTPDIRYLTPSFATWIIAMGTLLAFRIKATAGEK